MNSFRYTFIALLLLFVAFNVRAQTVTLSGNLQGNIQGAAVRAVSGSGMYETTSGPTGDWSLSVPSGESYTISVCASTNNPLNGLSTYDWVLISQFILGDFVPNSPYKIIAADINLSGSVDFEDLLDLRRLILGIYPNFPGDVNFVFVPASYVFPDPVNPFNPPYPTTISTGILTQDLSGLNFVTIRLGDINNTADGDEVQPYCNNYPSKITGLVALDENDNCQVDNLESPRKNWVVTASNGVESFSRQTLFDGSYTIPVPPGTYTVTLLPPGPIWGACDSIVQNVTVADNQHVTLDFSAHALAECPLMEVELTTPILRRCSDENYYIVHYANNGSATAENAHITVEFDPYFEDIQPPIAYTNTGNSYNFELGDVPPDFEASFVVYFTVSCDVVLGQTHCTEAHIYPDTLCNGWNGANLVVTADCDGDQVHFTVTNIGADMTEPVNYVVVEDIMIQMVNGSIQLASGQSQTLDFPANGSTWRVEVQQPEGHPFQLITSTSIEGCGVNGTGTFSLGFVDQFPTNDEAPYEDVDCLENVGSWDPNDKQGWPQGVSTAHFIPMNQPIEYLIRFQNTGTDTAFYVNVIDSLSPFMDIRTLKVLNTSHPCEVILKDKNTVFFEFRNIELPDSNASEPASHGFVRFRVNPLPGVPEGTQVFNFADIFFDLNMPVRTNTTLHTYGEQYLSVSGNSFLLGSELNVWPNPGIGTVHFGFSNARLAQGKLLVYDLNGRLVLRRAFSGSEITLESQELVPGMYLFRIDDEGKPVASGKLAVVRE